MWKKEYWDGGGGGKHCSLRENCRIWNVAGFVGLNTLWVHLIFTQSIFIQNLQCTRLCTNFRGGLYHSLEPQHWYQVLAPQKCSIAKFHGILQSGQKKKTNSNYHSGLPWWLSGKESACQCRRCRFNHWVRKIPWRRKWQPQPVFLPGKFHGQRSLKDYSPWGRKSRTKLSD